jgi:hypothetical protein
MSLKTQVLFLPRSYHQGDTRETDQGQRTRTAAVPDPVPDLFPCPWQDPNPRCCDRRPCRTTSPAALPASLTPVGAVVQLDPTDSTLLRCLRRLCGTLVRAPAGISLHFRSARRYAVRDAAERVGTPSDGWGCRQAICPAALLRSP